ncbi:N-acetylmuramic acid 6-phosphate etherase [Flammeovirga kamogawensis]|uniref:N-acetylmuramic acid 6-phosphate etherase n=1 Tax=Flammeovirga kamogawensis TaxID=373891 RepID=A0ABX8GY20_9BACT|nr:N-acetylmuramic acid 6-phosphate etherase [Flammeovirga kamogawensis]MBB6460647.1 N-acetylmuramic acid 6-phosphate etherase [Flammeovirga kamogawensis]QWG08002.1 N-acetylmuramic acid 6-phosphate etherase [Flammeovirga kamogawensis]TRX69809.1 N-acetylmuramic acid 6-phosphate etherase [Flammeovirga kamogawensis]
MITESSSNYNDLEKMSVNELLHNINKEDQSVPLAIQKAIPQIEALVNAIVPRMKKGGKLFYIGAGTSGRLGVVDASECPPTFGVPFDLVVGIIAGGDGAIRKAVEHAEDDNKQAWIDLKNENIGENDSLIGIAASGRTPYVIGGMEEANKNNILTGCIVCNPNSKMAEVAQFAVEPIVGPEFVTGSTRMKAGTAQKLALNMISTSIMIQLGKVKGNKMVDMQLTNHKLEERAIRMVMDEIPVDRAIAESLLAEHKSVRGATDAYNNRT